MAVSIKTISDDAIEVNCKPVYKDADGKWIAKQELTNSEVNALYKHLNHVNNGS